MNKIEITSDAYCPDEYVHCGEPHIQQIELKIESAKPLQLNFFSYREGSTRVVMSQDGSDRTDLFVIKNNGEVLKHSRFLNGKPVYDDKSLETLGYLETQIMTNLPSDNYKNIFLRSNLKRAFDLHKLVS